jgi:ferredoxin
MSNIYQRLAKYLDSLPAGFPPSEDGIEIQLLKHLFTEEEAALTLHLGFLSETAPIIARKAGSPPDVTADLLETMVQKGLISGSYPEGGSPQYAISQFVIGFYEGQVDRLSPELVDHFEAYAPIYFEKGPWKKFPQVRTIPINETIPITSEVLPYFQVEEILQSKTHIAVRNCVCRQEREMLDQGCGKPMETCFSFDGDALNTVQTGIGRMISHEEATQIVKQAQAAGLVLQPANSQNPIFMCACCSCCCGVLRHIKDESNPGDLVANPFVVHYDGEVCTFCGACVEICPMEALTSDDSGAIKFEQLRCIGCGLCVSVCPSETVKMVLKIEADQPKIPKNTTGTYLNIAKTRGISKIFPLINMFIKHLFGKISIIKEKN